MVFKERAVFGGHVDPHEVRWNGRSFLEEGDKSKLLLNLFLSFFWQTWKTDYPNSSLYL